MGYFLSRQRDKIKDFLYVEIAVDKKNTGLDAINKRYDGEGKNLYSPVEAVIVARKIMDLWNKELPEELKKIRVAKSMTDHTEFEYSSNGLEKLVSWAEEAYLNLPKCIQCHKIFGGRRSKITLASKCINEVNSDIYEKLKLLSFCSLDCAKLEYKKLSGQELTPSDMAESIPIDSGMYYGE